jgi:hypothetical protein
MDRATHTHEGNSMPETPDLLDQEEEPLLTNPPNPEVAAHVRDYLKFTNMMKWGAIVCLIAAFLALIYINNSWR